MLDFSNVVPIGVGCCNCGQVLTEQELHYYGKTCNDCEGLMTFQEDTGG